MRGILGAMVEHKGVALDESLSLALRSLISYPESKAGVAVTHMTALQVTTVLDCVHVLANGVSQVPWKIYRPTRDGRGSEAAKDHPLYRVLYRRPNAWQTSFEFRQMMVLHRALTGNFFAYISRVGGRIHELLPLEPGNVEVVQNRDLSISYKVTGRDGSRRIFGQREIWHLRGLSWDGCRGLDAVRLAREAIGLALATEGAHADLHRNGVQTSGLYSVEGELDAEQYPMLQKWIESQVKAENRFRPMVIDRNAKFTPIRMTGVDSEHLATRKHQIEEICRAFNLYPQMIGHAGDQAPTFASAEAFFTAHVVNTLTPWYEEIDQSVDVNLLDEADEAAGIFSKFNANGLLRGNFKDRMEGYARGLGSGGHQPWLTPNDVRALEDMNPIEGGDALPKPPGTRDDGIKKDPA